MSLTVSSKFPGIRATIVLDSIGPNGARLTTIEAEAPRFILAEINTHRDKSRGSASSRAVPGPRMLARVRDEPAIPVYWGKNQAGMQAETELEGDELKEVQEVWDQLRLKALEGVAKLHSLGLHKQLANRPIETWMRHAMVVSATEWGNFDGLRRHKAAQPEFRELATCIHEVLSLSKPQVLKCGEAHLPYVTGYDEEEVGKAGLRLGIDNVKEMVSIARVCRVSYLNHDGDQDIDKDIPRYRKLVDSGHMCFDDRTEVLTARGWVRWESVSTEDQVFAVDPDTRRGSFEKPMKLHQYDVDEELYHVYGQQLDLKVTLNHRMIVSSRKGDGTWTPFAHETAEDIIGRPRRYLKAATYDGHGDVPAYERSSAFLRLLGFFVGDGYALSGNQVSFHLKKKRKVEYLKSLGFPVTDLANHKYTVSSDNLGKWFRENCYAPDRTKVLPVWVLALSEAEAFAVLDGLRNSDGSNKQRTWRYDGTSRQVIDTLQALLHIHGKTGSISHEAYGDDGHRMRVNVSDRVTPRVETGHHGRSATYVETKVHYKGRVYCATVSTGALLVRRNGHVSVSGNSPTEHVAYALSKEKWEAKAMAAAKAWVYDRIPVGNFWGWEQYRKRLLNEHDFSKMRHT